MVRPDRGQVQGKDLKFQIQPSFNHLESVHHESRKLRSKFDHLVMYVLAMPGSLELENNS
jgi:hypothetical protein